MEVENWRSTLYAMIGENSHKHGRRSPRYMAWVSYVVTLLESNPDIATRENLEQARDGHSLDSVETIVRHGRVTPEELIATASLVLDYQPIDSGE